MNPYSSLERWYISCWFLFKILMQWQIFSEMFNDYANLRPWKKAADLLAQEIWGPLYDLEKLARNGVPVSAVTWVFSRFPVENWIVCKRRSRYFDDMFVVWFSIQEDVYWLTTSCLISTLFKVCWFWLCSRHGVQDQGYRAIHHEPALPWWDPRWRQGRDETAFPDIPERVLLIWLFLKSYFSIRNLGSSECHILLTLENMERLPLSDAMTTYKEKRSVEAESWEKPWGGSGSVCSHPSVCVSSYDGENNKKRETLFSQRAIKPLLLNGFWGASSSHSK